MKTKVSAFLKQMVSTIVAVVKAKSTVVRAKTSALKTRLLVLGVLRNKKLLMAAINTKIRHAIMGGQQQQAADDAARHKKRDDDEEEASVRKAVVLYSAPSYSFSASAEQQEEEDSDDEYLTHTLFAEEDDELVRAPGSVIDVMRDAREREQDGAEFRLEDEIDHVADVFIRRIHRQLKLQKLDSFKRFCETLERRG
jgi:hypothetical protein